MDNKKRIMKRGLLVAFFFCAQGCFASIAGFDVFVVDADNGTPLQGVEVLGWFANNNGWKAWTESAPTYESRKITDYRGFCHVMGETNNGEVGMDICKLPQGYYNYVGVSFRFKQEPILPLMHWRPTDLVVTAALYKIKSPIPLFVKKARMEYNAEWPKDGDEGTNAVLRYDFLAGDWLPPFGKGAVADMTIRAKLTATRHVKRWPRLDGSEYSRTIRFYDVANDFEFEGSDNGIIRKIAPANTSLRIRTADSDGYGKKDLHLSAGRRKTVVGADVYYEDYSDADKDVCYVFRIRTRLDEKGNLIKAYYGKIYGDFQIHGRWKDGCNAISFVYYLNPTPNDRNLEWDMKNNLCPNPGNVEIKVNHRKGLLP